MKCILLFLSLVCSLSVSAQYCSEVWSPDNGDGTYTNPVINADYSDPDVVAVGDDYYLTASSFNCMHTVKRTGCKIIIIAYSYHIGITIISIYHRIGIGTVPIVGRPYF